MIFLEQEVRLQSLRKGLLEHMFSRNETISLQIQLEAVYNAAALIKGINIS